MTPTGYSPGASSIDDAAVPVSVRGSWTGDFELRCADVHSPGCDQALRAQRPGEVVELAREHGARVHAFTPAWYSKQRLATIATAIGPPRD